MSTPDSGKGNGIKWHFFIITCITFITIGMMFLLMHNSLPFDSITITVLVSVISAFLGVALTMGVTYMQLKDQSRQEKHQKEVDELKKELEEKNKDFEARLAAQRKEVELEMQHRLSKESIVFQQRLKVYQEFLSSLFEVIKDGQLDNNEKLLLQFQTSYIATHTTQENINEISSCVRDIIRSKIGKGDNYKEVVLDNLFRLVYVFRRELYPDDNCTISDNLLKQTLENFSDAFSDPSEMDEAQAEETADVSGSSIWQEAVKKWNASGWKVDVSADGTNISIRRADSPDAGVVTIGFRGDKATVHVNAPHQRDWDFARALKWFSKSVHNSVSYYSYWRWHTPGNAEMQSLTPCNLIDAMAASPSLATYITELTSYLLDRLDESRPLLNIRKLWEANGIDTEVWTMPELSRFSSISSRYDTGTETEGTIFINLLWSDSRDKILMTIANGDDKTLSRLEATKARVSELQGLPMTDNHRIIAGEWPVDTDPAVIAAAIDSWMKRLA